MADGFRDGAWLAGLADAGLVPSVVMQALGVRQSGEAAVVEALVWRLRSAELLLVLDNCEHLLDACAELAVTLLGSCPGPGGPGRGAGVGRQAAVLAGDPLASQTLERAAACAQRSGNHRAEHEARRWLAATFQGLPIPADAAVSRAEQLLEAAADDPWDEAAVLQPLILVYGYAGRLADARAAARAPPPSKSRRTTWRWSPTPMTCCSSSRPLPRLSRPRINRIGGRT